MARPLQQASALALRIGNADLRGDPEAAMALGGGDAGRLLQSMSTMNAQLASRIAQLRSSTTTVAESAGHVAAGSRQLALHSVPIDDPAAPGVTVLAAMDAPLAALLATTERIAALVDVVDDIAFRTTVLALNVAIDAARCGDTGDTGDMASVSTEIAALAQRSALAARHIKALIDEAGQQRGCLADQASLAARELAARLSGALAAVDKANREQHQLADENARAAAHLRDQAGSLSRLVDSFHLGPEHAQPAPRIMLVASNPGKLSTPARAVRNCTGVMPLSQDRRGGAAL